MRRLAAEKLGVTDVDVFDRALQETRFSTAVGMLKDAIPPKLRMLDGANPLTLLYKPPSVQLATGNSTLEATIKEPNHVRFPHVRKTEQCPGSDALFSRASLSRKSLCY